MTALRQMSDTLKLEPGGLAGLLAALRPRVEPDAPPPPEPDLDAIRNAGWAAGHAAGEAAAAAALAPLRLQLAAAAAALDAACTIDMDGLRPLFVAVVREVAQAVLAAEIRAGAAVLEPLVTAALGHVRIGEAPVLHAHPDTLAGLCDHLDDVAVAADPTLARDEFSVSAAGFLIEVGLSRRLAEIVERLA